ncbi:hypothetical protein JI721_10225 [Alicyclobacillus cycloheptanicus]|uniref:Anti-sigma factor RsiW n=1 Tax=Alicyclobacillus cycloheptanicus TaxID=1457 RepID=A0ABT9XMP1_9BACL|nr:zf-HC2 domain-containing protein [Alicyclobacillus cycloheptanicus]MDQ0191550.1 anti-sigma factor RsiW [Alicyclobacillus cycloheptanicus]WDM00128.1 hypothetical protein JI721_10225 [Alicyclobacillus cycloheptanicus]
MQHLTWDELWQYADGEAADAAEMEQHLAACPRCAKRWQTLRTADEAIVEAFRLPPELEAPIPFALPLDEVPGAVSSQRARRRRWIRWSTAAAGVAAALVLAAVIHLGGGTTGTTVRSGAGPAAAQNGGIVNGGASGAATTAQTSSSAAMAGAALPPSASTTGVAPALKTSVQVTVLQALSSAADAAQTAPLAGANVAVVSNHRVIARGTTGRTGNTPQWTVTVPVDPVYAPSFSISPGQDVRFGSVTVVVWKTGYQPQVMYRYPVGPGGSGGTAGPIVLHKSASGQSPVHMAEGGPPLRATDNYVQWAQQAVKTYPASPQVPDASQSGGERVQVLDQSGHPIADATVVVAAGSRVDGWGKTTSRGTLPSAIVGPGLVDARWVPSVSTASDVPVRTVTITVFKAGYAPAVGFYQPMVYGQTRTVTVHLQSLAWRQSQGMDNSDVPSTLPGDAAPDLSATEALLHWVQQSALAKP